MRAGAIRCRKRSSSPGDARSSTMAFSVCVPPAFSDALALLPPDRPTRQPAASRGHAVRIFPQRSKINTAKGPNHEPLECPIVATLGLAPGVDGKYGRWKGWDDTVRRNGRREPTPGR